MADANDLFGELPDYDVFTDSTASSEPSQPRMPISRNQNRPNDYGDGFGEYIERETRLSNFTTLFFFPFIILWLEVVLRLGTGESFLSVGVVYTLLFSVSVSCVLTLFCTFAGERLNRFIANIIAAALTLLYLYQLVYYNSVGTFFMFSKDVQPLSPEKISSAFSDNWFFLVLSVVPLLVSLLVGRKMFRFKRIRVSAKILLVILAAAFHLIAFGLIYTSQFSPSDSYTLYHNTALTTAAQERFGLITMQRIDLTEMIT